LNHDRYELDLKLKTGRLRSRIVEGFDVPVEGVFDEQANLAAMQGILDARQG
jgi:hypothetical protein